MNPIDSFILHFLNQFAQGSALFDASMDVISTNVLFKGALIMALFWWIWCGRRETTTKDREFIVSGFMMTVTTLFVARALALVLPFRERPRFIPQLAFRVPSGSSGMIHLIHWSSFPSDNAAFYFSLATTLYFVSRKLGVLAYFHALVFVSLPRIYLGLHFPSDIAGGALLGVGIASLSVNNRLRSFIAQRPLHWMEKAPAVFYPGFYFVTFLLATEFEPLRDPIETAWHLMHQRIPACSSAALLLSLLSFLLLIVIWFLGVILRQAKDSSEAQIETAASRSPQPPNDQVVRSDPRDLETV